MIVRATAIPLAIYPYSSTSHVVHWLTRHQGKISTLLRGALRPKSPFLGEYELFSTSELLYFAKHSNTLHAGKECALLHRRDTFRTDWRAMQMASYLSVLFDRTTPENAPHPELFELLEELLDLTQDYGRYPQFLFWAELRFCKMHGHTPHFGNCALCASDSNLRFCASQGGVVCASCAKSGKLPTLECPPDILAIMRSWQLSSARPESVVNTQLNRRQLSELNAIVGTFMMYQFNLQPEYRIAVLAA